MLGVKAIAAHMVLPKTRGRFLGAPASRITALEGAEARPARLCKADRLCVLETDETSGFE